MSDSEQTITLVRTPDELQSGTPFSTTSQISYVSNGHTLVIGDAETALDAALKLKAQGATVVYRDPSVTGIEKQLTDSGIAVFTVPQLVLTGHLGAYKAIAVDANKDIDLGVSVYLESGSFDLVLDMSETPLLSAALKPFGYLHVPDPADLDEAVASLGELVGEFDKPRYFDYKRDICAHSRSKLDGCNRCVDVCTTSAIRSDGEGIVVDPFLCQGCGSCATVCPSGAMSYAFPRVADAIHRTRELTSEADTLLLHTESQQAAVDEAKLATNTVPLLVEEVSAFGLDYWLSLLAGHVGRIVLLHDGDTQDANHRALVEQSELLHALLSGLGINETVLHIVPSTQLATLDDLPAPSDVLMSLPAATFAAQGDKRQTIRMALDHLSNALKPATENCALPSTAPFGHINVDTAACTLCMACVSTCPAKALLDGQDTPALRMVEANCLQCGLCAAACPESAITLESRYTWDSVEARRIETLHDETPFHCISCHTAFTTSRMIETMTSKLAGHWMFTDDKAIRRLKMCGDCRVKDMFEDDAGGIAVHKDN